MAAPSGFSRTPGNEGFLFRLEPFATHRLWLFAIILLIAPTLPPLAPFLALAQQTGSATNPESFAEPVLTEPAEPISVPLSTAAPRRLQLTFGSQAILDSCWSAQELEGSPKDKWITKSLTARPHPPAGRGLPQNTLKPLPAELQHSIRSVEPQGRQKLVALTFDLCENAGETTGYDADIVNYLRRNKVKATFFATGKWMLSHAEKTMQLMADPLFEMGNHSWSHRNFRTLDRQSFAEEVLGTQIQYELLWEELMTRPCVQKVPPDEISKIQAVPLTFRFPFGTCNREAVDFLARSGLPAIQWTVVTGDPAPRQPAGVIGREVLRKTRPGSIIIAHANGRGYATAQALPLFIPKLIERGYQFVTISELLAAGPASAARECYEIKPGDNVRYDRKSGTGRKK